MEKLNFKGKRKRSKLFRTRLSRFAYQHLAQRLEHIGKLECFQVTYRDPAFTSQDCPECGCRDSRNRYGETFLCVQCGHKDHADINGGININGGEAVFYYDGLERSAPFADSTARVPGDHLCPADETEGVSNY